MRDFETSRVLRARARARRRSAGGPHVSVGGRRPPLSVYRECCAFARAAAVYVVQARRVSKFEGLDILRVLSAKRFLSVFKASSCSLP